MRTTGQKYYKLLVMLKASIEQFVFCTQLAPSKFISDF